MNMEEEEEEDAYRLKLAAKCWAVPAGELLALPVCCLEPSAEHTLVS